MKVELPIEYTKNFPAARYRRLRLGFQIALASSSIIASLPLSLPVMTV